jgi:hypothetical protein
MPGLYLGVVDSLHDSVSQRVTHLACGRDCPDDGQIVQGIFTDIGKSPSATCWPKKVSTPPHRSDAPRG